MPVNPLLLMGGISLASDIIGGPARRRESRRLAAQYRKAYEEARRANIGRYGQMMRGYEGLARRGRESLKGFGRQARADITRGHAMRLGGISQSMVSRGLSGTTVGASLRAGAERERVGSLGRLEEGLQSRRFAMESGLEQARLGAVERRTDAYPDFGELQGISQARGAQGPFGGPAVGAFMQNLPMLYSTFAGAGRRPAQQGPLLGPGF